MNLNKEKNFISAVIYTHNSEKEIKSFIETVYSVLDNNFNSFEIIVVDDSSTDRTIDQIRTFTNTVNGSVVSIINMSYYQGLELSMNAGINLAIGDFVFEFDSVCNDFQPDLIFEIYKESLKGFDIVSASPKYYRNVLSMLYYKVFNLFSNITHQITTESFRIISRRGINRVHAMSKTIPYRKALYSNCGLKMKNIVYSNDKNKAKVYNSNMRKSRKNVATDSFILFTDFAYKTSLCMTIMMMLIAFGTAIYTASVYFGNSSPVEGWTTTMMFLSLGFFAVFAILAIIIKYLTVIVDLIFKKQDYVIESIEKLKN